MIYAGRYRQIKRLGSGDTGTVFLVHDEKTGADRAIKFLNTPAKEAGPAELEGFQREFETLKDLNHPSIAKVFDAGLIEELDNFYIVTEFASGQDLFEFAEGKSIEIIEELFVQALRALNYIHSKNIVHLDIKPQNMLVGKESTLKLIDFGYANFYKRTLTRSQDGNLLAVGTAPYLSPEIIKGESIPDHRADLYSLGCTFYKVLTREVPFSGANVGEIYYKHLNEVPRAPSTFNKKIPEYLDKIILKLLEKNPDDRYQSAQEVINDLNLLSGRSYDIESVETRLSYIPQKGKLIGREKEFAIFKEFYTDRIYLEEFTKKSYLVVKGKTGTGKTRFLEECKNHAQAQFVRILSWKEFQTYSNAEDVPTPALILADGITFDSYDLEYLEVFFEKKPILVLFATNKESADATIILKDFTIDQTREYLLATTGLPTIPDSILNTIYTHTQGNPLYLTEYVRTLFEKGFFKDAQGSWSLKILEDLGSELATMGATELIKKWLKEKIENLSLTDAHLDLLYTMAIAGKPTFEDLSEMTNAHFIEEALEFLVAKEILEVDPSHRYSFTNPISKEVVLEKMPKAEKEKMFDRVADYFESLNAPEAKIFYYRGRGGKPEAGSCLLKLAEMKKEQNYYLEAEECLLELIGKNFPAESNQAKLKLGEIFIETGKYVEANKWLVSLIEVNTDSEKKVPSLILIKAYEQLGLSHTREGRFDEAAVWYEKGQKAVVKEKKLLWLEVSLKNRLARNEYDKGNLENSEIIFSEAWGIWKNKLNDQEKFLANRSDIDLVFYDKQEYNKAISYLEESLSIFSRDPHSESYPVLLYRLAKSYLKIGNTVKGEELLNQCLEIIKKRKTPYWAYNVYNELGGLFIEKKQYEKSLTYYRHAFELAYRTGGTNLFLIAYNIATISFMNDSLEEAKKYYIFAVNHLRTYENKSDPFILYLYVSLLNLSLICRTQKKVEEAKSYFAEAALLFEKNKFLKPYAQYYWQEKAGLACEPEEKKEALAQIEYLKTTTEFDKEEYARWLRLSHPL